ncbi:MAG: Bax inhibitor-1 family protein [Blastocatellia bacterium]|nr:Bax inhibitor-1 family protein [Chloracidobacterium sp.]MBL8183547.1 Bax inhibitor-1 family protein [Blastocatellia bacterium]HBE82165.1 permease [Blastocatellia bacterium]HRJ90299.1 Bax inhibitor-1 family protein [Pyrinomonadaceae bacterium]HRK50326.1 Bax inhibitor-1 family protein [Pyrinomonadaceae bacterium]
MNEYTTSFGNSVAEALPAQRAQFIRKTYLLLAAAILAFIGVEAFLFASGAAGLIANVIFSGGSIGWLAVLALFMGVSFLANRWAMSETSKLTQFLGLGIFIVAEAVIFVPLIMISTYYAGDASVLMKAGIVTLGLFLGITATVFITKSDFSFLGPILAIGGFIALGFIVSSAIFGFSLGSVFAFVMVAFAGTAILYETSNVLHRFNTSQHVAASLTLFASIALLFWYILTIFSSRD